MPRNPQAGGSFQPNADYDLAGEVNFTQTPTLGASRDPLRSFTTIAGDGAIALKSGVVNLTKGSAAAITIAAPTVAQNGMTIVITAGSSFAHVITGTNLFWAGETGGPFNKITLAAFIGSSATIVAVEGLWHVVSDQIAVVGD